MAFEIGFCDKFTLRPPFSPAHKLSLKETERRGGGEKGKDFLVYFAPSRDYQAAGFTLCKAVVDKERETLESGRKKKWHKLPAQRFHCHFCTGVSQTDSKFY